MAEYGDFFGTASAAPQIQTSNFFTSRTWTAPQNGILIMRAMGAGGGGARGTTATGGYSGSWGVKVVRVAKGDTAVVTIGAGGTGKTTTDGDGAAGGDTTIVVGGVTYTAYGGPGGKFNLGAAPGNGPAPSANWDAGAASVKPGWASAAATGGAGVDILAQGGNATTSASVNVSGGGGTGGPSVGSVGGGAIGTKDAMGNAITTPIVYVDASSGEWGISFYGGAGGTGTGATATGGNGGGGAGATTGNGGHGGGGGGAGMGSSGGSGGIGGGGGACPTTAGNGGNGFAHFKFFADLAV